MAGDVINGQYEVRGCINYGGLGWIYLAKDQRVGFYVVLKGLINTSDTDDRASMEEELEVLARVDHPSIVTVHNFVDHPDRHEQAATSYVVEEYVPGQSLRDLRLAESRPDGSSGPLPLQQVITYTLEILSALGHLHSQHELLYCDLKPDNIIQTGDRCKLVDLGAARKIKGDHRVIYGTVGYQAPEVSAGHHPTVSSDLYTVGRTMAALSFDFDMVSTHQEDLPSQHEVPLLRNYDSYARLLRRATDHVPERRFSSVEEMTEQLQGVFREVLAADDGMPHPDASSRFEPETQTFGAVDDTIADSAAVTAEAATALPAPQVDPEDPSTGLLASVNTSNPTQLIKRLRAAPRITVELRLRIARTLIELGDLTSAAQEVNAIDALAPGDWRVGWYRGVAGLAGDQPAVARAAFEAVRDWLPGEAAPKLALALATERGGDPAVAANYYEQVWRTDHSFVSAAFGLARTRLALGESEAAIRVLDDVPESSSHYTAARVAAIRAHLDRPSAARLADLQHADARIGELSVDVEQREKLAIELFSAARDWIAARDVAASESALAAQARHTRIRGRRLREHDLRLGLENSYRALARLSASREERYALVDQANRARPLTWV